MKTRNIIYPLVLLLMIGVPVLRYYSTTPEINGCVLEYVDGLENNDYRWYMYDIKWVKHLEPWNSSINNGLEQYKIWESYGCLMVSNNLFNDLNNTFYCAVTYMIRNAPIHDSLKQPLEILQSE